LVEFMESPITIGIMQGRLSNKPHKQLQSFPWDNWKNEFANAASLGFDTIEWLVDGTEDLANPIASAGGRECIREISARHGIKVGSLCAHTFMDGNLLSTGSVLDQSISHLKRVIDWADALDVKSVILPAMDALSLRTLFARERLANILKDVLTADGPAILLESDLSGGHLAEFVTSVGNNRLGVLYDLGNSNAMGFDCNADLIELGSLVREIHIKDRKIDSGASQRLGLGGTPFSRAAQVLGLLDWKGPLVLETPVFDDWNEEAKHNLAFTRDWLAVLECSR
jgi:hexulose-6-phosphate isomerase